MSDGQHEHETVASGGVHAVSDDSVDSNEEAVDPRVQVELERLNSATDLINKLEIELDEARSSFRLLLSESTHRVNQLSKKLGSCVEKARPYYEARMQAKQLQAQTQKAALRYERASGAHAAAKEMVYLAEEGLKKEGRCFDPAWQEMLNHATMRVNEAESERIHSEHEHQQTSSMYNEAEKKVQLLHQQLKRSIVKSSLSTRRSLLHLNNLAHQHQLQLLPYFEMKARFNQLLEEQRKKVHHLEENVLKVKMSYADALHNLEEISDEIHQKRKLMDSRMSNEERSEGVGAESPDRTWNNCVKLAYQLSRRSISSEDLFPDSLNPEDTYLSLPSKLSSRQGLFSTGSLENDSQGRPRQSKATCHLPVILQNYEFQDSVGEKKNKYTNDWATYRDASVANSLYGNKEEVSKNGSEVMYDENSDTVIKGQQAGERSELESGVLPQTFDRSPDGAEVPDQKFSVQDLNILRVQREDLSDSESLASNDTIDTLDDNQIECLMLDQVLPLDMQDMALTDSEKVPSGS